MSSRVASGQLGATAIDMARQVPKRVGVRVQFVLRWRYLLIRKCVDARRRGGLTLVAAQLKSARFHAALFP